MRACVQIGLLFLSVLISSIYGEETDQETSMEGPVFFDMEDLSQFQVAENEQERNLLSHDSDIFPVNLRVKRNDKGKKRKVKKPRPGTFSTLAFSLPTTRVTRQTDNTKQKQPVNNRRKPRPGMFGLLGRAGTQSSVSSATA
ncbi:uncharacterized protein [Misgurnus anguillicaudatus]|uniref:uncharacterized protein isoform X2 n=1 Tax=Misgurnus anguillicaudatus TaxID=75329 RepID=UPI003CCF488D